MAYADSIRSATATMEQVATLIEGVYPADGWRAVSDSWAYASATTITVPTDATLTYSVGDRIKFVQTSTKYFVVVSVASTVLTVSGGTDYTVANAAITSIYHSKQYNPVGYPSYFNYTPTFGGFSANPASPIAHFRVDGGMVSVDVRLAATGTSNATSFTVSAPFTAKTVTNMNWGVTLWQAEDNGSQISVAARAVLPSASSTISLDTNMAGGLWTASGQKRGSFINLRYPIA